MTENQSGSFGLSLGRGILMLILGILLLVFPMFGGVFATVMFSILLIFLGIAVITYGSSLCGSAAKTWAKVLLIILGVIILICGILSVLNVLITAVVMMYVLAFAAFLIAVSNLSVTIFGGAPTAVRVLSAITGVLAIILGVLFIVQPGISFITLIQVAAIFLFVFGLFGIIEAIMFKNSN